jgi:hypothetical protein
MGAGSGGNPAPAAALAPDTAAGAAPARDRLVAAPRPLEGPGQPQRRRRLQPPAAAALPAAQPAGSERSSISQAWSRTCQAIRLAA